MGRFLAGFVVGAIAGVLLTLVFVFAMATRTEPTLVTSVDVPAQARIGEPFAMRIVSRNPHDVEVQLHSVDIDESFIEAFEVLSINPQPTDSMRIPFLNQQSWFFERDVPPGASLEIVFTLNPVRGGVPIGNVEVCNPAQDCIPASPEIEILAEIF
ncbi:MAG: hypothetical protein JSV86_04400 [Gemmatimonadota bacterium]|nr:MAG: hypothetical protein JSV86_04400 [Gemmatimonadota bacterium]